ncbi:DUF899 family protein [Altererythrobacter sp. Root672]|uniref:DUF899 family protein n=1 Tax=Altererythrobacter sp. Root672 TaxID=1736584 RepID=UPI000B12EF9B|nr:DUF899 family protein [Altererythrobacter sp. Root672]
MTANFPRMTFPNESSAYREARNALLDAEIALRRQTETVAEMRRGLPPGGEVPEDFEFERIGANHRPEKVRLSQLFGEFPSIMLYSFMFGPERDTPCPGCTHLLDGIDGSAEHVAQRAPFYVVSRSPIARLEALAHERGWDHLAMLSTAGNSYSDHYYGNTSALTPAMREHRGFKNGENWDEPMLNVFRKDGDRVSHFWGSELVFAPDEPGQNHRAMDFADPVWGLLDTIPEGRGETFFPKLSYA